MRAFYMDNILEPVEHEQRSSNSMDARQQQKVEETCNYVRDPKTHTYYFVPKVVNYVFHNLCILLKTF